MRTYFFCRVGSQSRTGGIRAILPESIDMNSFGVNSSAAPRLLCSIDSGASVMDKVRIDEWEDTATTASSSEALFI